MKTNENSERTCGFGKTYYDYLTYPSTNVTPSSGGIVIAPSKSNSENASSKFFVI